MNAKQSDNRCMKRNDNGPADRRRLTGEQRARLQALADLDDAAIDTSDAPELTDEQWAEAEQGRFYRPFK